MSWLSRNLGGGWLTRVFSRGSAHRRDDDPMGRALMAALEPGQLDDVETWLGQIVRGDSDAVLPYLALARLYRRRGDVGRSIQVHQNLLLRKEIEGDARLEVMAELAEDFRRGGFLQRAVASFEEVLELAPRHEAALEALIELYSSLRAFPKALATLKRLGRVKRTQDRTREADLLVRMAAGAHESGLHGEARKAAKRALRRSPENVEARVLLGRLEAEKGRDKAALAAWTSVLEQGSPTGFARAGDPEGPDLYSMVAASFAALDRARDYEGFLRALLLKRPGDVKLLLALAGALAARGETGGSIATLRDAIDRDPENLEIRLGLSRLLLEVGRNLEALEEFRDLLDRLEERRGLLSLESLS